MKKLWNKISFLGLEDKGRDEALFNYREVILINRLIFIFISTLTLYLPVEIIFHGTGLIPIILAEMIIVALTLLWNLKKKFMAAKIYFFVSALAAVCPMMFFIPREAGNQYFLIPAALVPVIFFRKDWQSMLAFFMVVALYYFIDFTRDSVPDIVEIPTSELSSFFSRIFIFIVFILLFAMVYYFKRMNRDYENLVISNNETLKKSNEIISEKNKEITDSINYARRIQRALLASDDILSKHLPEYFVLFKPKDIVSGDFYWARHIENRFYLALADCTGHGVPGAFMSLLNISLLKEAVMEKKLVHPHMILNEVRKEIILALNPDGTGEGKDGMDCVLCSFNHNLTELSFACANNPLWIVRNNEFIELTPDKMPVGIQYGTQHSFSLKTQILQKGDSVYMFSDGYADQFGGPKGKKFKYRALKELILSIHHKPMPEQKELLGKTLETWRGSLEQVDDISIIGIKI